MRRLQLPLILAGVAVLVAALVVVAVLATRDEPDQPDAAGTPPASAAPSLSPSPSAGPSRQISDRGVLFDFAGGLDLARAAASTGGQTPGVREEKSTGGAVRLVARDGGWAARFPGPCTEAEPTNCPRAILEADKSTSLNPGAGPLRWGAAVLMQPDEVSDGSNVVQKGYSQTGGQFKLQVDGMKGLPSCVIAGAVNGGENVIHVIKAEHGVADGRWHQVDCVREGSVLQILVDGAEQGRITIPAELSIDNDAPLRIGGKGVAAVNNDQFHGTLDDVYVDIG